MLHLSHDLHCIFIEVLGNEDVDMEMTNFFFKVWKKLVKAFSRA
jgi:hypothetical protein